MDRSEVATLLLPDTLDEHGGDTQRGDRGQTRIGAFGPERVLQGVEGGSMWVVMSRWIRVGKIA
jgi:hypothetical protein